MKRLFLSLFTLLTLFFSSCSHQDEQQTTKWDLMIKNDLNEWIPARMSFTYERDTAFLNLKNATETIRLAPSRMTDDTTFYDFIDYHATIAFAQTNDKELTGYWVNYEDDPVKKRPVKATPADVHTDTANSTSPLDGRWRTKVILPTRYYEALLFFQQKGNRLYGTMRTKSTDYRFLEGKIEGDAFYLSAFSGNSVFYLKGELGQDTLRGRIHGLKTDNRRIKAFRDPDFQLPDRKTLTKIVNDKPFQLDLKDETGSPKDFKQLIKNKVSIVSIFGTWCPNCVDEVDYFKQLKKKYPEIKIICVAFEATEDEAEQRKRVQGFKARKDIHFPFLIGGKLEKENVLSKFPMIDDIKAYPTFFILDKTGTIVESHTGFTGPATGALYENFKKELEGTLEALLRE